LKFEAICSAAEAISISASAYCPGPEPGSTIHRV
jgi:hypothetical protein